MFLAFSALIATRAREHAVLRAIGAPQRFILAALWMELDVVLATAVVAGTGLGWALAAAVAAILGRAAGLSVTVALGWPEALLAAAILTGGLVAAALPAFIEGRAAPAHH